jgi:hypothetical protein
VSRHHLLVNVPHETISRRHSPLNVPWETVSLRALPLNAFSESVSRRKLSLTVCLTEFHGNGYSSLPADSSVRTTAQRECDFAASSCGARLNGVRIVSFRRTWDDRPNLFGIPVFGMNPARSTYQRRHLGQSLLMSDFLERKACTRGLPLFTFTKKTVNGVLIAQRSRDRREHRQTSSTTTADHRCD